MLFLSKDTEQKLDRSIDRLRFLLSFFFFFVRISKRNVYENRSRVGGLTNKIAPCSEISDNYSIDRYLKYQAVILDVNYLSKFFIERRIQTVRYFNNLLYYILPRRVDSIFVRSRNKQSLIGENSRTRTPRSRSRIDRSILH